MHAIIIHAAHMSGMNNRYHHITLQSTLMTSHRAYKDHMAVINITSYNRSKLGLSTEKINKWLREALSSNVPFHEGPDCCLDYTTVVNIELQGGDSIGGPGSYLKT